MVSHMYCLKPYKSEEHTNFSIFSYLHKLLPWRYSPSKYWGATWSVVLPVNCRAFPSTQNVMCTGHTCMKSWRSVKNCNQNNLAKLHLFHACNVHSFKASYHCVGEKFSFYGANCFSSVSLQDQRMRRWVKYFPFHLSFYISVHTYRGFSLGFIYDNLGADILTKAATEWLLWHLSPPKHINEKSAPPWSDSAV